MPPTGSDKDAAGMPNRTGTSDLAKRMSDGPLKAFLAMEFFSSTTLDNGFHVTRLPGGWLVVPMGQGLAQGMPLGVAFISESEVEHSVSKVI